MPRKKSVEIDQGIISLSKGEKIFKQSKKWFDEYLKEKYPKIDEFIESKSTKDLSKIVPLDYLKKLLKHHRIFAEITRKPKNTITELSKRDPLNFTLIEMEIVKIKIILKGLMEKGWLNESDPFEIEDLIFDKIFQTSKGKAFRIERGKNYFENIKGGPWPKFALNFIIYFLVEYAKENSKEPHYDLITSFLSEQGVVDGVNIGTRYKRIDRNRLWGLYNRLRLFDKEYFDRLFKSGNIPDHLKNDFRRECQPEFVEFYHPSRRKRNLR